MGLLDQCEELFKTSNLYDVIGVTKDASEAEIRRGYYKVSLQVHPDRATGDEQATAKFQALGKVYAVLSDADQRAIYDEQGVIDEESDSVDRDRNWEEYWRTMFPKITLQDILDFEKSYKDSEEEKHDLMRAYEEHKGDMDKIMENVLCATQEDEPRIRAILQCALDSKELPPHRAFTNESAKKKSVRKRKADKERKEAEEMQKEMGLDSEDSLVAMIKKNQKSKEAGFNNLMDDLEAKYCKKKTSSGRKGKK
ncbi:dnaJ homolog subfamily C member 9 [Esox lucius]|uniref:DnaJ homolog subfamily C member 9 n=1 Tax=Esox lucius TaxID=8010 RepID=A0A3P8XFM7_ESOLU|nr:dnaJ homolog subfamily C member 9 [Esox lucius]XP_010893940.1 dnaJ homolog subfamily C member 9 [Esox lucius]